MATEKKTWAKERYVKRLKDSKESYEERKKYLASWVLPGQEEEDGDEEGSEQATESTGSAEADNGEVVIGNYQGTGDLVVPAEHKGYRFTSPYKTRWGKFHYGIDLAPPTPGGANCKILAAGDGVVVCAGSANGFGQWIVIKHSDNLWTIYGHMTKSSMKVKVGDKVKKGQHIAMMGKEGRSTGVHLHFEITRNFSDRTGTGPDGKCNTMNPEDYMDVKGSAIATTFSQRSKDALAAAAYSDCPDCRQQNSRIGEIEGDSGEPMHGDYSNEKNTWTEEGRKVERSFRTHFSYRPTSFQGKKIRIRNEDRKDFLLERIGWGRTTDYSGYVPLDKEKFIHQEHYDGYEGNLYSPDAKRLFENLLLKTKKPYFEIISGFRFSNKGQFSPHEAGCAIDILVRDIEEVREIADCAWQLGVRSIAIGGDFTEEKGFIHIDIAPKGEQYQYGEIPIYGGPGKWDIQ